MEPRRDGAWLQALLVWCVFFALLVLINGTVPFLLGADLHAWVASATRSLLVDLVIYSGMFMFVPVVVLKGWRRVLAQPLFVIPLLVATAGISLWTFVPPAAALVVIAFIFLHQRFDLSGLGIRSRGWGGDALAITLMGALQLVPVALSGAHSLSLLGGFVSGLDRWLANPASTVENLFYFGFITDRLSQKTGRWLTPPLVGAMYTAHEMSNPEYWYGGLPFGFVFVGVTAAAWIYLWRRSVIVAWLGDGMGRFFRGLFS